MVRLLALLSSSSASTAEKFPAKRPLHQGNRLFGVFGGPPAEFLSSGLLSSARVRLAFSASIRRGAPWPVNGPPIDAVDGHTSPSFRWRFLRSSHVCCRAVQADFFHADVVQYGNRYNRPDRFPRLKQATKPQRNVDVIKWLDDLVTAGRDSGCGDMSAPNFKQVVIGEEAEQAAAMLQQLIRQGRLDEAMRLAQVIGFSGCAANGNACEER